MANPGPWYANAEEWDRRARAYMDAVQHVPMDSPHGAALRSYRDYSIIRLIFESNRMENEKLPQEGETRALIDKEFPKIPPSFEQFRQYIGPVLLASVTLSELPEKHKELVELLRRRGLDGAVKPSISFGPHNRPLGAVIHHYEACLDAEMDLLRYHFGEFLRAQQKQNQSGDTSYQFLWSEIYPGTDEQRMDPPGLFSLAQIKKLHAIMSEGYLPSDAQVQPGEYRIDDRTVGPLSPPFAPPALIPASMEKFVTEANAKLALPLSPWQIAASISYDLTIIHPFPDFNGRVARLLLSMVLAAFGLPFRLALRGDATGRKRYRQALERANRGNMDHYTTLIARTLVESFEELDAILARAGLAPVLSFRAGDQLAGGGGAEAV